MFRYNIANGGPAPESVTSKIYELTKTLAEYNDFDIILPSFLRSLPPTPLLQCRIAWST